MKTVTLNPYQNYVQRKFTSEDTVLFICETDIESFDAYLPDAQAIKDAGLYFQKDDASNTLGIRTQFGQSINGVERVTLYYQYQSVFIVSDGNNYRLIQGIVPELPATLPLGLYWRFNPTGYDLNIEKDLSLGGGTNWTPYDELKMN